ncbi:MAG: hypothetical protein AAFU03_01555, partial [Bacteroidota bacterium]
TYNITICFRVDIVCALSLSNYSPKTTTYKMKDLPYLIAVICMTLVIVFDYSRLNMEISIFPGLPFQLAILFMKIGVLLLMIALIMNRVRLREQEEESNS